MKKSNTPVRMCVACRRGSAKDGLFRLVRTRGGGCLIDTGGKMDGRGAYICKNGECVAVAVKKKALQRALKIKVEEEIYNELARLCGESEAVRGTRK